MTTVRFMLRLVAWRRWEFIANCLAWAFFHSVPLCYAALMKALFDTLSPGAGAGYNAWTLIAILAAAYGSRQVALICGHLLFTRHFLGVQMLLRRNLLDYLLTAPGSRVLPESPSQAVSRFRDDVDEIGRYAQSWAEISGTIGGGAAAVAFVLWIDPTITAIVCGPLICMTLVARQVSVTIRRYRQESREAAARVTDFIGQTVAGVQAIKVFGGEDAVAARFASLSDERRLRALADVLLTEFVRVLNGGLVNIGVGVVLLAGSSRIGEGSLSIGDFAVFTQLLPRIASVLTFVGGLAGQYERVGVSLRRLEALMVDAQPEHLITPTPLVARRHQRAVQRSRMAAGHDPLQTLEVQELSFQYPTSHAGIYGATFSLRRGQFVVITGRVGAGKSTLVRVLLGLLPRASGRIEWNGRAVVDPAAFLTPPRCSYTAQVPRLFSDSLRGNVVLGAEWKDLDSALDRAAMGQDVRSLENGVDTVVGARGVSLSGGQIQRACAARMLACASDLMVIDDLSSSLDVATEQTLWDQLHSAGTTTCLVVSNRRAALRRADHILVVRSGRISARGTLNDLLVSDPWTRLIFDDEPAPDDFLAENVTVGNPECLDRCAQHF